MRPVRLRPREGARPSLLDSESVLRSFTGCIAGIYNTIPAPYSGAGFLLCLGDVPSLVRKAMRKQAPRPNKISPSSSSAQGGGPGRQ